MTKLFLTSVKCRLLAAKDNDKSGIRGILHGWDHLKLQTFPLLDKNIQNMYFYFKTFPFTYPVLIKLVFYTIDLETF